MSLKPDGGIPGDATAARWMLSPILPTTYSFGEIRVTHEQNLVLPNVRQARPVRALATSWPSSKLATANIGLVGDIIACPGLDYCALANARSIPGGAAHQQRISPI